MGRLDELHGCIRDRIDLALGGRSWRWLACEAGIPQSTLASQASKLRFSVAVLVAVADALQRPVTYFVPSASDVGTGTTQQADALRQIAEILEQANALARQHLDRESLGDLLVARHGSPADLEPVATHLVE